MDLPAWRIVLRYTRSELFIIRRAATGTHCSCRKPAYHVLHSITALGVLHYRGTRGGRVRGSSMVVTVGGTTANDTVGDT